MTTYRIYFTKCYFYFFQAGEEVAKKVLETQGGQIIE